MKHRFLQAVSLSAALVVTASCGGGGAKAPSQPAPSPTYSEFTRDLAGALIATRSEPQTAIELATELFSVVGRSAADWQRIWAWSERLARSIGAPDHVGLIAALADANKPRMLNLDPQQLWLLTAELVRVGLEERPGPFGDRIQSRIASLGASLKDRSLLEALFRQSSVSADYVEQLLTAEPSSRIERILTLLSTVTDEAAQGVETYTTTRDRASFVNAYARYQAITAIANEIDRREARAAGIFSGILGFATKAVGWIMNGGWNTVWNAGKAVVNGVKNAVGAIKGLFKPDNQPFLTPHWIITQNMVGSLQRLVEANHAELRSMLQAQAQQLAYLQQSVDALYQLMDQGLRDLRDIMREGQMSIETRLGRMNNRLVQLDAELDVLIDESLGEIIRDVRAILIETVKGRVDSHVGSVRQTLVGFLNEAEPQRAERDAVEALFAIVNGCQSTLVHQFGVSPEERNVGAISGSIHNFLPSVFLRGAWVGNIEVVQRTIAGTPARQANAPLSLALLGLEAIARLRQKEGALTTKATRTRLTAEMRRATIDWEVEFLQSCRQVLEVAAARALERATGAADEWHSITISLPFGLKCAREHRELALHWVGGPDFDLPSLRGRTPLVSDDRGLRSGEGPVSYRVNGGEEVHAAARDMIRAAVGYGLVDMRFNASTQRFDLVWDLASIEGFEDVTGLLATAAISRTGERTLVDLQGTNRGTNEFYDYVKEIVVRYEAHLRTALDDRLDSTQGLGNSQAMLSMLAAMRMVMEHLASNLVDPEIVSEVEAIMRQSVMAREQLASLAVDPLHNGAWETYVRGVLKTQASIAFASAGSTPRYLDEVIGAPQQSLLGSLERSVRVLAAKLPQAQTHLSLLRTQVDAYCNAALPDSPQGQGSRGSSGKGIGGRRLISVGH